MKKSIKTYNKKSEKGAITLFVLIACMFFGAILMSLYISNLDKLQVQEQEINQIRENYSKELKDVDEIYSELVKE